MSWLYQPIPAGAQQDVAAAVNVFPDSWINEWRPPARRSFAIALIAAVTTISPFALTQPEATTIDRYYLPLSEPVRQKSHLRTANQSVLAWSTFTPAEVTTAWIAPFSEPVRFKVFHSSYQRSATDDPFSLTQPETVMESRWHQPWSEPVRIKQGFRAWHQQFFTIDPYALTQPETTTVDRWFSALSEPVRQKPHLRTANQSVLAWSGFTPVAEVVTLDKWLYQLSEPVRQNPRLTTANQFVLAWGGPEIITIDKWFRSFLEPTRRKLLADAQYFSWSTFTPAPSEVTMGWQQPFFDPVRTKTRLLESNQQFLSQDFRPIVSFGWFENLSDPVRIKLRLPTPSQIVWTGLINPVVSFGWYGSLSDPPIRKKFNTALQRAFTEDTTARVDPRNINWYAPWREPVRFRRYPTAGQPYLAQDLRPVVSFGWYGNLRDPVRIKPRLSTPAQVAWTGPITPTVSFGWYGSLRDPVRIKLRLQAGLNPFIFQPVAPVVSFGWYGWLSDPPKRKAALRTANQQFTTTDPFPIPNQPFDVFGWFGGFSEPVRVKPGMLTSLQREFGATPRILPNPTFLTMAAVEDNEDVFSAAIETADRAHTVIVSIEEIPAGSDAITSIREP